MGAIFRREMGAFFTSGIAYVFLAGFALFSGLFFSLGVIGSGMSDISPMFSSMFIIVVFLIPILTMRLLSEEKKNRTDQGLLTAPISLSSIVLGKYFAAFTLFSGTFLVSCLPCLIMYVYGAPNTAVLLTNMLGILFVGAAFIAIGIFISSLTENQLIAAVLTIFVILFSLVIGFLADYISVYAVRFVVDWFSFYSRYYTFTQGFLSIPSILYFISVAVIFIFLTVRVYETRRWK